MEKPQNEWPTKTAFPAYHTNAALVGVLMCHLILMEGRVNGEKRRQTHLGVDDIVRSTWQPEVKHQLNSRPWGREVVVEALHFHHCRTTASMLERVTSLFVCKAVGASVTSRYNKSSCLGCWLPITAYVMAALNTALSPPQMLFVLIFYLSVCKNIFSHIPWHMCIVGPIIIAALSTQTEMTKGTLPT